MKWKTKACCLLLTTIILSSAHATPSTGITFSPSLITQKSDIQSGWQFMLSYDPDAFHWRKFNLYFDAGFSHFKAAAHAPNRSLSIFSIAPIVRYTFNEIIKVNPYIELSIGVAYLNRIHFDHKNLGMHFAFQDRLGLGIAFGTQQAYSIGIHALHYSNAHLAKHNSGVTVPVLLDLTYRFK